MGVNLNEVLVLNKKILFAFLIAIIVWLGITAFVVFKPQPKENFTVHWYIEPKTYDNGTLKSTSLTLIVANKHTDNPLNISGCVLNYLPSDWGYMWIEQRLIPPKSASCYYWVGMRDGKWVREEYETFFNLLDEGKLEPILEIVVESTEGIYTFHPQRRGKLTDPTTIEEK